MHWVVQDNMFNEEGFGRLLAALVRLDVPYSVVKVVPFSHEMVPDIKPEGQVVVMGTYTLSNIAHERGWTPGSFENENFNYQVQSWAWPGHMLNDPAWIGRFADVPEQKKLFFARPVHDSKSFIGQVYDWGQFEKFRTGALALLPEDQPTVTADTQVLVAPKAEIWSETRVWMVDKRAVTASLYKFGTIKRYDSGVPRAITDYAETLARKWQPSRAYVVDIFDTPQGLKVGEVNNLNCAGFYAGDMQRLVAAIDGMDYP